MRKVRATIFCRRSHPDAPVTGAKAVSSVIEKFREKYGAADVKKYHLKFNVAVVVQLI